MYFRIAAEVILAIFAVFGLYSAVRIFAQKFFSDKRIFLAIEIKTEDDVLLAEGLIKEALGIYYLLPSARIAVLASKELEKNTELVELFLQYGVEYYFVYF